MASLLRQPAGRQGQPATRPPLRLQIANFAIFQAAWFATVVGAAHGWPLPGTACVAAAIGWHLAVSARPGREARLIGLVLLFGLVAETVSVRLGYIGYASGQLDPRLPPYWIVALWGLFAIALNVTLRWLKGRPLLAAAIGAVAGPAAFWSGVRLGCATFVDTAPALASLALIWAAAMPLLMHGSMRFDGVSKEG